MAYSHVEAQGDETKGNSLLPSYKQTSKTAQTASQRVFGSIDRIRVNGREFPPLLSSPPRGSKALLKLGER
jgi:hypothetical protein